MVDTRSRRAVVRNGYLPEREILAGMSPVSVKVPKVHSRMGEPVVFHSSLVPPYVRKARRVEVALPWLYLKGIATGRMREALEVLKKRYSLDVPLKLAVGDGALGFWSALEEECTPETRHQCCWVFKTVNVLNYLPKAVQSKAKRALQEIWMAEDRVKGCVSRNTMLAMTYKLGMSAERRWRRIRWVAPE